MEGMGEREGVKDLTSKGEEGWGGKGKKERRDN